MAPGRNVGPKIKRPDGKKTLLRDEIVSPAFHPHMGYVALHHKAKGRMAAMRLMHAIEEQL